MIPEQERKDAENVSEDTKENDKPPVCPTCQGEGTIDLPFGGCYPCPDCQKPTEE